MEYEDYKRAKQLQEETLPAFERIIVILVKMARCIWQTTRHY